jgi:hypothetical protein
LKSWSDMRRYKDIYLNCGHDPEKSDDGLGKGSECGLEKNNVCLKMNKLESPFN